jgi:phage/plasmid-like protein (TIGR03299 family)
MAANVETMFSTRTKPWHGLGTIVAEAPDSKAALSYAGLDWNVLQREVFTEEGLRIPGYYANVRDSDFSTLGIVSERYKVVQNQEAFAFTDQLLGEGVTYETAGALQNGRIVWILAKMPEKYIIAGDEITPYLVVMNSHNGSTGLHAALTPIRVVCQNTLNLALSTAKRSWTTRHTENIFGRINEAEKTLFMAESYMTELGKEIDHLNQIKLTDSKVIRMMESFYPASPELGETQRNNNQKLLDDIKQRYFEAPDLAGVGKNGYRFINAVSDFVTHVEPVRKTKNYKENLFLKTVDGNAMIDKAYKMVLAA